MLATLPVPPSAPDDRLDSWKEIAAYLKRGVRTVQRWEQAEGLPIHRLAHDRQSTVFAYKTELDAWWTSRRVLAEPGAEAEPESEPELETPVPALTVVPPAPPARRRWRWAAAAAGVAALLAAGIVLSPRLRPPAPLLLLPLTTETGFEGHPSFSPDGTRVVYYGGPEDGPPALYIKTIGSETVQRLTPLDVGSWAPAWSPDGRSIAFFRRTKANGPAELRVIDPAGHSERLVAALERRTGGLSWTPDSRWIVTGNGHDHLRLRAFGVAGEGARELTSPDAGWSDADPSVAPDGQSLVFLHAGLNAYEIRRLRIDRDLRPRGEAEILLRNAETTSGPTFTPDGAAVIYSAGLFEEHMDLWRLPVSPMVGQPEVVLRTGDRLNEPALSAKLGRLAVRQSKLYRTQTARVALGPAGVGKPEVVLSTSTHSDMNAQYSPDGRYIAFNSTRSGFSEVWLAAADGSRARPLTQLRAAVSSSPRWSPDGEWVVFESKVDGQFEIYRVRASGGDPERLTHAPGVDALPSYSRDGRSIYFASDRGGAFDLWKMPAEGGEPMRVTSGGGYAAFESPDGRWLYYTTRRGSSALWRRPAAGGPAVQVAPDVSPFLFVPVEDGVLYAARGPKLYRWRERDGRQLLGDLPDSLSYGFSVDPAARYLLLSFAEAPTGSDILWVEGFGR